MSNDISKVEQPGEVWDYDEGWADRERDVAKLRSQIKIMAKQLREYDRIDQHNREENHRLRRMVDPFFNPDLTIGEQIDLNQEVEARVVEWLRNKGYTVTGSRPGARPSARPRRGTARAAQEEEKVQMKLRAQVQKALPAPSKR